MPQVTMKIDLDNDEEGSVSHTETLFEGPTDFVLSVLLTRSLQGLDGHIAGTTIYVLCDTLMTFCESHCSGGDDRVSFLINRVFDAANEYVIHIDEYRKALKKETEDERKNR